MFETNFLLDKWIKSWSFQIKLLGFKPVFKNIKDNPDNVIFHFDKQTKVRQKGEAENFLLSENRAFESFAIIQEACEIKSWKYMDLIFCSLFSAFHSSSSNFKRDENSYKWGDDSEALCGIE